MVGKLPSLDFKARLLVWGLCILDGFDKFWDDGGAVTPDVAATSLIEFVRKIDIKSTGEYWAKLTRPTAGKITLLMVY